MKTPKLIVDHLKKLERYGYQVGEDMTEDGKRFVFINRGDGEEAFALTWMFERVNQGEPGGPEGRTVH